MDGWQVRVNCKGEMVILQAQPPAQPRLLSCAAEVLSSMCGPHLFRGYIGGLPPSTFIWQVLISPLLGARNCARC